VAFRHSRWHSSAARPGLLRPEGIATVFGGNLAVMDLPAAQRLLDKDRRVDQIDVILRRGPMPLPCGIGSARPSRRRSVWGDRRSVANASSGSWDPFRR